uniref:NTPase KAP family P-loop domain containing 1 n=1 Tax=Nothoprocta perdicaria TaxID=30464 RepID=A0A8C6ZXP5_NOTPE
MKEEMARREEAELLRSHQRPRSPEGWGLLLALWYLAFYKPVITELHLRRRNMEFIFIRFSAWQYAGCDKLWAGLVTTLCDSIRHHFGALPLSVYHVLGSRPRYAAGFSQREWELKRGTCLKLWGLLVVLSAGLTALLVALLVPGVKENHALKVIGSTVASLSGSGLVLGAASILKNLFVSEKKKIERLTNSEKFTSQLGFMSKVRGEVEALVGFLAFMEIFERRQLRVVLEITSLDICYPEKVAGVLNAMNTLLSDANSPFIFLLAVDPSVIVPCLEQTSCMRGLADNGYLYLNRTVTLPFSIPEMGARSKLQCLEEAVQTREDLMYPPGLLRRRSRRRGRRAGTGAAPGGMRLLPPASRRLGPQDGVKTRGFCSAGSAGIPLGHAGMEHAGTPPASASEPRWPGKPLPSVLVFLIFPLFLGQAFAKGERERRERRSLGSKEGILQSLKSNPHPGTVQLMINRYRGEENTKRTKKKGLFKINNHCGCKRSPSWGALPSRPLSGGESRAALTGRFCPRNAARFVV